MPLEEVFELRNGYTPSKKNDAFWEGGTIPWFRMEDIRENGRELSDAIQHITPAAVKGKGLFAAGSFIMATTATIGEHALLIVDSLANQRFTNLRIRKSLDSQLDTRYCFHYLYVLGEWCKQNVNAGGFASVDMGKFRRYPFPIPPLEEQRRIATILDKFERLTTSLQEGIPAEIEARRQQYCYYRDKLLGFRRKDEGAEGSE
ncbi:MAG: restriction endonuclease subunit S [Bacteroidaceae bacterium]|nr:restriction endonuclease subunit S [Bacteroidaceae bacterium]